MYFDTRKENLPFYAPFKLFAELFPLEAQIMRLLKCDDYTQFPILLQKIESKLILEELGRELHDTPFLTLHDSLIFRSHCEDQVVTVLNKVFTRHLQTVPRLERTVYTPSRAFEMLPNYLEEKLMKLELKFGSNRNDSSVGSDAKHNK
jgi:hypothetical protein